MRDANSERRMREYGSRRMKIEEGSTNKNVIMEKLQLKERPVKI